MSNKKNDNKYRTYDGKDYETKSVAKEEVKETKKVVKTNPIEDFSIPYPDKGGHTVSQIVQFTPDKRKAILGEKNAEFEKKYL